MLLLDIEAELSIRDRGRVVWSEEAFPVAELAYHLALWLQSPATGHEDVELDSMQADPGLIRIGYSDDGWWIGSISGPVGDGLVAAIAGGLLAVGTTAVVATRRRGRRS
ncbi:hypothetical protein ACIRPK_36860 [Kitasatospora sp. NPDC101801]|uniref:DUF7878 domain-containing protein n=1 Tax=Kitasatospora sp. NPDC101801 TaxID=3364103 RepID=UPI003829F120